MAEPVVVALLTADRVTREDNGKYIVSGIFDQFNLQTFPGNPAPWGIYFAIDNFEGKHRVTLNLVHDESSHVAFSATADIEVKGGGLAQVNVSVPPVVLPSPGGYTLSLHIEGEVVAARSMRANKIPEKR